MLDREITFFKYLTPRYHERLIRNPLEVAAMPRPLYVTLHRFYGSEQALRALALYGPLPTHVMELRAAAGTLVQGPAYINPVGSQDVHARPDVHRYGNGIEFAVFDLHLAAASVQELKP